MLQALFAFYVIVIIIFLYVTRDKKVYVKFSQLKHGYYSLIPEFAFRIDIRKAIINRNITIHIDYMRTMYIFALYNDAESRREKRNKVVIPRIKMKKV
jgi:hypothetical protein